MKLNEAIEKLKWLSEQISPSPIKEAIDTVVSEVEKHTYTPEDMEAFAEFLIGRNTEWITELERNETAKTLIELWEQEMRKKDD